MPLYLSGGGNENQARELNTRFAETLSRTYPLVYIPIAMGQSWISYEECHLWFRSTFAVLGISNTVMWTEQELPGKTLADFRHTSGVYLGGGNTFKLLKELREWRLLPILRELAAADFPLAGGSAGAILFGRTITTALPVDENEGGLTDLSALDLLGGADIWCHYTPALKGALEELRSTHHLGPVLALPEDCGLLVRGGTMEVIGPGQCGVFGRFEFETLRPGALRSLSAL